MSNKHKVPQKNIITTKHIVHQIHRLRIQLKAVHEHDIKQAQRHLNKLKTQLAKTQLQHKQSREKKKALRKLIKTRPTKTRQNRLQKIEQDYLATTNLITTLKADIKQARDTLKQHKTSLTQYIAEERMVKHFHKNWRKDNPSHSTHHHPSIHPAPATLVPLHPTPQALTEHFDMMQITQPPAPTDGPDQPQCEADQEPLHEGLTIPVRKIGTATSSAYANYMLDDDFDDDPAQI